MKGRKPKDIAMKILNGNAGHRIVPSAGGDPFTQATFDKPEGLDEFASQEWDRLVDTLAPILSPASSGMVLVACDSYSEWRRACALIEKEGETYETTSREGQVFYRVRPEVSIRKEARQAYCRALSELGASPVAHTRVKKLPSSEQGQLPGMARLLG